MVGSRKHTRYTAGLRRLFGVAALLGLFAMHGLAAHGTAHDAHAGEPMAMIATAAADHSGADHSGHSMTTGPTADRSPMSTTPNNPAPDHGLLGMASMCLVVLLICVGLVVLLGRRLTLGRDINLRRITRGWPTRARRDRDPPCLFALSIQRC